MLFIPSPGLRVGIPVWGQHTLPRLPSCILSRVGDENKCLLHFPGCTLLGSPQIWLWCRHNQMCTETVQPRLTVVEIRAILHSFMNRSSSASGLPSQTRLLSGEPQKNFPSINQQTHSQCLCSLLHQENKKKFPQVPSSSLLISFLFFTLVLDELVVVVVVVVVVVSTKNNLSIQALIFSFSHLLFGHCSI